MKPEQKKQIEMDREAERQAFINAPWKPTNPWVNTEPCYRAETNAHISAFFARNMMRRIEAVAAKHGINLQR